MRNQPIPAVRSIARAAFGLAAAGWVLVVLPALPRPLGPVVAAHSQLVSSIPGAGQAVDTPPTELRLQFSESIAAGYTSFDVLDGTGKTLILTAGHVDATDDHLLVGALPALGRDTYTVDWRALSAADGHVTEGALTFAVTAGASASPGASAGAGPIGPPVQGSDTIHVGHDATQAAVEVQGKVLAYGGVMLAFGLPIVAWFVIRPALGGRLPRVFALGSGIAQVAVAVGIGLLIVVSVASLPSAGGTAPRPDAGAFLTTTRPGQLLVARLVIALAAGAIGVVLARMGRAGAAFLVALGGSTLGIALVAVSGHAAAFDNPVPILVDVVHVMSGATWLSGLLGLAVLSDFGGRFDPPSTRAILPRYSALAIVSIGLVSATGIYADWTQTRELISAATPYAINLDVKVLLVLGALGIGALNFMDGGTDRRWLGGLSRRVLLELGLAVGVVVVTANLTSGSPSWENRPIAISPAPSTSAEAPIDFAVQPGRPGPNRFIAAAGGQPAPTGTTVTLILQRLDSGASPARIALRASSDPQGGVIYAADGGLLVTDSRWDATVTVTDASGTEVGRRHFTFSVDAEGVSAGRALPPIDPVLAIGLVLAVAGLFGLAFGIAGGSIPRTPPDWGRQVLVAGSGVGTAVGALIIAGGAMR
jgi:copper transport protein